MTSNQQLLALALFLFGLEVFEFFAVRKEGRDIFPMKFGWRFFYFTVIASCLFSSIYYLPASHRAPKAVPFWWSLFLLALSLLTRPKTLVAGATGLASYGWYGFRRRFIPWAEVSGVTSDWQEVGLWQGLFRLWLFTGYSVAVIGRDGTRIMHTIQLRHQAKFLDDLRLRVPANAFAPGLFDWHP